MKVYKINPRKSEIRSMGNNTTLTQDHYKAEKMIIAAVTIVRKAVKIQCCRGMIMGSLELDKCFKIAI